MIDKKKMNDEEKGRSKDSDEEGCEYGKRRKNNRRRKTEAEEVEREKKEDKTDQRRR